MSNKTEQDETSQNVENRRHSFVPCGESDITIDELVNLNISEALLLNSTSNFRQFAGLVLSDIELLVQGCFQMLECPQKSEEWKLINMYSEKSDFEFRQYYKDSQGCVYLIRVL